MIHGNFSQVENCMLFANKSGKKWKISKFQDVGGTAKLKREPQNPRFGQAETEIHLYVNDEKTVSSY